MITLCATFCHMYCPWLLRGIVVTQMRMCHGLLIIGEALSLPPCKITYFLLVYVSRGSSLNLYKTNTLVQSLTNRKKKNRELKVMYKKAMQGDLAAHIKHL